MAFLATIPIGLLTLLSPNAGVVALFGLLPFYLVRFSVAGIPTTFLEMATYAVAAALVIKFLLNQDFKEHMAARLAVLTHQGRPFFWILLFFLAAMLLATFYSVDLRRSLGVFKGWVFDPILAGLILYLVLTTKKHFSQVILLLSLVTAGLSFYGLLDFFVPDPNIYNDYLSRLDSVFTSANYHALLVGPVIIMSAALLVWPSGLTNRLAKIILWGSLIFNLWAFYLTYSYGGYLGLTMGLVFLLGGYYFTKPGSRKIFKLSVAVLAVVVLAVMVSVFQSGKFERDFKNLSGTSALRGRMEIWRTSSAIIAHHPVLGLGLGNFDEGYEKYVSEAVGDKPLEAVVIHAHNIFLNFWNEAGLPGVLAILAVLIYALSQLGRAVKADAGLALAAAGGLIVQLGHGLIDTPYFKNDLSFLFWLSVFMLFWLTRLDIKAIDRT